MLTEHNHLVQNREHTRVILQRSYAKKPEHIRDVCERSEISARLPLTSTKAASAPEAGALAIPDQFQEDSAKESTLERSNVTFVNTKVKEKRSDRWRDAALKSDKDVLR